MPTKKKKFLLLTTIKDPTVSLQWTGLAKQCRDKVEPPFIIKVYQESTIASYNTNEFRNNLKENQNETVQPRRLSVIIFMQARVRYARGIIKDYTL